MDEEIIAIIAKLAGVQDVQFADEDTGQLDYYSTRFPVKFPCTLVDTTSIQYSDIGSDKTATPQNRQQGEVLVTITVANLKLTNSSHLAPQGQKDNAFKIQKLLDDIHAVIHGWRPSERCGALMRKSLQRIKRDDGVQEYDLVYSLGISNV